MSRIIHTVIYPLDLGKSQKFNQEILAGLKLEKDVRPGIVRAREVGVGRYRGAPANDCDFLLQKFCDWMNSTDFSPPQGQEIVYGIIKAVVAHLYFVWIHPFDDGNGRTARLLEVLFLLQAGVPSAAAHLLSNNYNRTRTDYYRQLDRASESGGDVIPFIEYAVTGFVEQVREQIEIIKNQQLDITWINYIHDRFRGKTPVVQRRLALVLAISNEDDPVQRSRIRELNAQLAANYADKTSKTITRDLNAVLNMGLIRKSEKGYEAAIETMLAFLPTRVSPAHNQEALLLEKRRTGQLDLF